METLVKIAVVVGGLVFSIAVALLIEELIFGQVFRMVFGAKPAVAVVKNGNAVPRNARSTTAN